MRSLKNPNGVGPFGEFCMSDPLVTLSIGLELGVFALLALSVLKGRSHLLGLAAAFLIYAAYDAARTLSLGVPDNVLGMGLMLAAWLALWSAWLLYSQKTA